MLWKQQVTAHFHSTSVTLGASISTLILVAKEDDDTVYLAHVCLEHQNLVPCILPCAHSLLAPSTGKQGTFVAKVYLRPDYLWWMPMDLMVYLLYKQLAAKLCVWHNWIGYVHLALAVHQAFVLCCFQCLCDFVSSAPTKHLTCMNFARNPALCPQHLPNI